MLKSELSAVIAGESFGMSGLGRLHEGVPALGAVAGEVRVLDHPDEDHPVLGIDSHVGGVSAALAEFSVTHTPPETVACGNGVRSLLAGHLLYGRLRKVAPAVE